MKENINEVFVINEKNTSTLQLLDKRFNSLVKIINFDQGVSFARCEFIHPVDVQNCLKLNKVTFLDCTFHDTVQFINCEIDNLIFMKCESDEQILGSGISIKLLLLEKVRGKNISISYKSLEMCTVRDLKGDTKFTLSSWRTLMFKQKSIETLSIDINSDFTGELNFIEATIDNLLIKGFNKSGKIAFNNVQASAISISDFFNTNIISFSNFSPFANSSLLLSDSNLGRCELFDIDFSSFKALAILNSNIQDIIPANIRWCDKIQSSERSKGLRETYRQLKNVMIRTNDKVEELKFHELEMKAYQKYLTKEKGRFNDKVIIWLNQVSNMHGVSWSRAISLLLAISFLIFQFDKLLLGYDKFNLKLLGNDLANWIESINPLRKFEDVYSIYNNSWKVGLARFIDILFRILYSFLIFQFIGAFRKYVKK